MFCSGCGLGLAPGQMACPRCGRPIAMPAVPPVPGFQFELANYANKIKTLSIVWFLYGGFSLVLGFFGLAFADAVFAGHTRFWMHGGPMPPFTFGPAMLHFLWIFIILRSGLALVAGWGLQIRAPWGRVVALVAAFLSLLKFPFGTALGIWTLVMLLGYRNGTLYEQLPQG